MKLKVLGSWVCISFLLSTASAETFRSFEFTDAKYNARADIANILPTLQLEINSAEAAMISSIQLKNDTIYFFKEITDFYNTINNPNSEKWAPIAPVHNCEFHQNNAAAALAIARTREIFVDAYMKAALDVSAMISDCQSAYQPELYINDFDPANIGRANVNNIPGLAQLIAEPFRHVEFASNFLTPDLLKKMRFLLTKVRMNDLLSKIDRRKKLYQHALVLIEDGIQHDGDKELMTLRKYMTGFLNEITVAESYLKKIDLEGRKLAEADRAKVLATGRSREVLPYPNLTDADREFITTYISAAMWRFRGGGVVAKSDSTQFRRIFYTWIPMRVLGQLNGGETGSKLGSLIFLRLFKMWGQYFDMGRNPVEQDEYFDLTKMTERGVFQVKSAVAALKRYGYRSEAMQMAGLQMGPCYYFSYDQHLIRLKYEGKTDGNYLATIGAETDWGELCVGAALGIGMSRSLLQGYDASQVQRVDFLEMDR